MVEVSVIMSTYNSQRYIGDSIESLLCQSFKCFELIIINDGSTDNSPKIIDKYRKLDNRIKVLNQKNRGLIDSLNRGLALTNGRYIARMDSDDISLPSKLEEQYNYLENNPDVGVLGTWIEMINEDGKPLKLWESPTSNHLIEWSLFFKTAIAGATIMMKPEVVKTFGMFRKEALHVEDYDFWARCIETTKIENLPKVLYLYRQWDGSICSRYHKIQFESAINIVMPVLFSRLFKQYIPRSTREGLRYVGMGKSFKNLNQIRNAYKFIIMLKNRYVLKRNLSKDEAEAIDKDASERLLFLSRQAYRFSKPYSIIILFHSLLLSPANIISRIMKKSVNLKILLFLID